MDFTGKNVLITGASRGIGKATALAFAEKGAHVGLNFRSNTLEAERTLACLPGEGHQLFPKDLSKADNCKAVVNEFLSVYGTLEI